MSARTQSLFLVLFRNLYQLNLLLHGYNIAASAPGIVSTFKARGRKRRVALAMSLSGKKIIAHMSLARTIFYGDLLLPGRLEEATI